MWVALALPGVVPARVFEAARCDPLFELLDLESRLLRFGRLLLFCLRFHDEISFRVSGFKTHNKQVSGGSLTYGSSRVLVKVNPIQ